jgi:hypothetical protein
MPSQLRSDTSRANGAKSQGPKPHQSYDIPPLKHGITARTLILQNESQDQFLEILNAYCDLFVPVNQLEIDIVSDIVAARWRLRRTWRYQTAMLDIEADSQAPEFEKQYLQYDEDMRGAAAFSGVADKSKGFATALRHDIHLARTYRRSVDDLRRVRGGNLRPKISVFQNEPTGLGLNPLDATSDSPEFSTEPTEPKEPRP